MRGTLAAEGATRVAKNGYHYTKVAGKWRLSHHIVAEKALGRPLTEDDRVVFRTGNKDNLSPDNIRVVPKGKANHRRRLGQVEARLQELNAEREYLLKELGEA